MSFVELDAALLGVLVLKIAAYFTVFMLTSAYTVYAERKISAFVQERIGPNRVGPAGLLQIIADAIKGFFKEDMIPARADRVFFFLAPFLAFLPGILAFAAIPVGSTAWADASGPANVMGVAAIGVGVLYIFSVSSISAYGLAYGGWASKNPYALIGGLRASAQLVSFEISMGLALVAVLMEAGSVNLIEIVNTQRGAWIENWYVFHQPLAFFIFLVSAFAETNRTPFDLPEAEQELVGGYHTEFGSWKFLLFMAGENAAVVTQSALMTTLFFGGWLPPFPLSTLAESAAWAQGAVSVLIFALKVVAFICFFILVRWTLPRFKWTGLMNLGWRVLIPLALLNILITGALRL